jgi:pimeloyl-ACP methyl ester carboxylesterase
MTLAPARGSSGAVPAAPPRAGARPLQLIALAVPAALAVVAERTGLLPGWAGLHHLVALPPLDLLADARVLLSLSPGVPWFLAGLAASLVGRTVLLAALLGGIDRRRLALAGGVRLLTLVPALVAAQLIWTGQALLYARVFNAGLVLVAVTVLVLTAVPWCGGASLGGALRSSWRAGLRVWVVIAYSTAVVGVGLLAADAGRLGRLGAVAVSVALTFAALRLLPRRPRMPAVPALLLAAALGVGAGGVVVATAVPVPPVAQDEAAPRAPMRPGTLVLLSGISSASGDGAMLEIDPALLGYPCGRTHHASYAGPGEGQPQGAAVCPIPRGAPYDERDTMAPFEDQVTALRAQLEGLEDPIVVAGHSQGAWVAWAAAAAGVDGLAAIVLVGPFPDNLVGAPPEGATGPGRVASLGLRHLLLPLGRDLGIVLDPDSPFVQNFLLTPGTAGEVFARPLPGDVAVLSVPATVDLPLLPRGHRIAGAQGACPVRASHEDLPRAVGLHRAVNAFLDGEDLPPCGARTVLRPLGVPFGAPPHLDGPRLDR